MLRNRVFNIFVFHIVSAAEKSLRIFKSIERIIFMAVPLICGLCGSEFVLFALMRWLGVPDEVTFTLMGVIAASLGFWLNAYLKQKNINIRHQLKIIILGFFALVVLGYWMLRII